MFEECKKREGKRKRWRDEKERRQSFRFSPRRGKHVCTDTPVDFQQVVLGIPPASNFQLSAECRSKKLARSQLPRGSRTKLCLFAIPFFSLRWKNRLLIETFLSSPSSSTSFFFYQSRRLTPYLFARLLRGGETSSRKWKKEEKEEEEKGEGEGEGEKKEEEGRSVSKGELERSSRGSFCLVTYLRVNLVLSRGKAAHRWLTA